MMHKDETKEFFLFLSIAAIAGGGATLLPEADYQPSRQLYAGAWLGASVMVWLLGRKWRIKRWVRLAARDLSFGFAFLFLISFWM
jgi:hypothetical protein